MSEFINIAGFWLAQTKDNKPYFRGSIGSKDNSIKAFIFKNDKKKSEKDPDYRLRINKDDLNTLLSVIENLNTTNNSNDADDSDNNLF